jgi:DNA (cytosine-5)-methyltransferase 1
MKYISICSGIEAASVAWHPLGWEPIAFSEIEPFPCAVLAHHWPHVPNLGDMTKYENWPIDIRPDLIVGGTPCQAFSVAGLRKGLADPRGNLTLTFLAIVSRYRPKWVVWENVPGVLSDGTGAFGSFLGGLGELGYGFAYRVLDAQYFGVAQRRRRVFVVAHLGDWRPAAAVLFERESLCGNPPPSRETRQDASANAGAGFTASSFGQYELGVGTLRSSGGDLGGGSETLAVAARMVAFGEYACDETASTMKMRDHKDATDLVVSTKESQSVCIAENIIGRQDHNGGNGKGFQDELAYTLNTVAAPAVAFERRMVRTTGGQPQEELSHCLRADQNTGDGAPCVSYARHDSSPCADRGQNVAAMRESGQGYWMQDDIAGTLRAEGEDRPSRPSHVISQDFAVRRLTPRECERLQGFPDDHTLITWRGKPASDGPRYKACGNSMAVPVMRWIGERIQLISEQTNQSTI